MQLLAESRRERAAAQKMPGRQAGRSQRIKKEKRKKSIIKKLLAIAKSPPARLSPVLYRAGEIVAPAPFLAILCALIRDTQKLKKAKIIND